MNKINLIIKEIRKTAGLSSSEVAAGVGISLEKYLDIESSPYHLTWEIYLAISSFWKIPPADLIKFHLTTEEDYKISNVCISDVEALNNDSEYLRISEEIIVMQNFIITLADSDSK